MGGVVSAAAWWWSAAPDRGGESGFPRAPANASGADRSSIDAAVPVEGDTVRRGALILGVRATGHAEASRRTVVRARVAGRIVGIDARESGRTAAGSPLVRLDPGEYALAVREAEAVLEEARARYRELTLFDDSIADPAVRRDRAAAARSRSGLARAEIDVRRAGLDLARTTVRAPFEGRVADVRVTAGAWVSPGEEILTLLDLDPIRVQAHVVEAGLAWIEAGTPAEVRLPAFHGEPLHGRVVSINPVVEAEARTARVTIEIDNPDERILPGMFARVVLEGRRIEDVVTVPERAVIERDGRSLVFVFERVAGGGPDEGRARWVYVDPGRTDGERVELVEGAAVDVPPPGAVVLVDGHVTLTHDAPVRLRGGRR